jgi:hypothetical protein
MEFHKKIDDSIHHAFFEFSKVCFRFSQVKKIFFSYPQKICHNARGVWYYGRFLIAFCRRILQYAIIAILEQLLNQNHNHKFVSNYPASVCKTSFQFFIQVKVEANHPTTKLLKLQHKAAGHNTLDDFLWKST